MNTVKEINLRLKNEPGQLSQISEVLGDKGINMIAFYASTDKEEGMLRFVANDPEKAINVLNTAGYKINAEEVIACETPHHPGGLNAVLKPLKAANINIDYVYPCLATGNITVLIIGVGPVKKAVEILEENSIRTLGNALYNI